MSETKLLLAEEQLRTQQPRRRRSQRTPRADDYVPRRPAHTGCRFTAPCAMHRARCMAKPDYAVEVLIFRSQFKLTPREEKVLQRIPIFVVTDSLVQRPEYIHPSS
ncbi:hypothetical protein LSAT2_016017, partial [Lamellibrachia satsuma]